MIFKNEGISINLSEVMREIGKNEVLKEIFECFIGCYGVLDLYDEVKRSSKGIKDFYDNEDVMIIAPSMDKYLELVEVITNLMVDKLTEPQEWEHLIFIVSKNSKIINYITEVA